jgi:hypothetical protein
MLNYQRVNPWIIKDPFALDPSPMMPVDDPGAEEKVHIQQLVPKVNLRPLALKVLKTQLRFQPHLAGKTMIFWKRY